MKKEDWNVLFDIYEGYVVTADTEQLERLGDTGLVKGPAVDKEIGKHNSEPLLLTEEGFDIVSSELGRRKQGKLQYTLVVFTMVYAMTAFVDVTGSSASTELWLAIISIFAVVIFTVNLPGLTRRFRRISEGKFFRK